MYRSGSSTRVSDELFANPSNNTSDSDTEENHLLLPTYNSVKKEKIHRLRSAETAVHLIPLLLILCAIVLWFCSTPEAPNRNVCSSIDPIPHDALTTAGD